MLAERLTGCKRVAVHREPETFGAVLATEAAIKYGRGDRSQKVVLQRCTQMPGRWVVYTGGPRSAPAAPRVNR